MLEMLRDLVAHKGHANAALLTAIRQNPTAASDPELWELLHHILLANRFWVLTVLGLPFVHEDEARPSPSFDALIQRYGSTQAQEATWLETATEGDLARSLEDALIPSCSRPRSLSPWPARPHPTPESSSVGDGHAPTASARRSHGTMITMKDLGSGRSRPSWAS